MAAEAPAPENVESPPPAAPRAHVAELAEWLLAERFRVPHSAGLLRGLGERLAAAGLPLDRVTLHIRELHPLFRGRTLLWYPGCGEVEEIGREHGVEHDDAYRASPLAAMDAERTSIRRRLEAGPGARDFPILEELAGEGYTDYCMLRLPASLERDMGLSLATRRPGGFAAGELEAVEALLPAFGTVIELCETQRMARLLLETYVGRSAGERVLNGTIRRGDGELIHAVLWLCDLHGFTALADRAPLAEVIATLNAYFDRMAGPVRARGGEILKFVGDAMLAIFPCEPEAGETCRAADCALEAAEEVLAGVDALNAERAAAGEVALDVGIGVHIGEVKYGNIGASDRLDFTVIGPAVNLVTRLQKLADGGERRVVVSEDIARHTGRAVRDLGEHCLKGLSAPQRAYALAPAGG